MQRSTFDPKAIFRRSIRLKQSRRTCWTIETHSDNLTEPDFELFMNLTDTKFGSSHEKFDVWPRPMITVEIH